MSNVVSWISAGAALASLCTAGLAYRFSWETRRSTEQREESLNKRDLFLSLHEKLCSADQMWGRRVIREQITGVAEAKKLRESGGEDWRAAAGALAMLDTVGLYVERGYVEPELVLTEWGHVLSELDRHARHLVEAGHVDGKKPWPHYQYLAAQAVMWALAKHQ
jgi:hypothetical protein